MKNILGLLSISLLIMASCTSNKNESLSLASKRKVEGEKLSTYLSKYQEPSQKFQVSSDKASQITGKQGTIIFINPEDLIMLNGQPLGKNIEVELQELTNQNQLLNSNAQTVSDGKLLVSGGAYYINMTSYGQQLKLKEGKSLKVQFPQISSTEMSLFYGQRDSSGQLNWKQANQIFRLPNSGNVRCDSTRSLRQGIAKQQGRGQIGSIIDYLATDTGKNPITKEEKEKLQKEAKLEQRVYDVIDIKSFGWINCDHFLDDGNLTNLVVKFNPVDSIIYPNVYLVFQDINSLMGAGFSGDSLETAKYGFSNIPIGYKVRLVAFTVKGDKVYSYSSDITVQANQTITLPMKETSENDFKKLLRM